MNEYFRTFLEVDLGKIKNNYLKLQDLVGSDRILAPVIKADAYGYGSVEVARALSMVGADFFIVATVREAIELREGGVSGNILVLGYAHESEYKYFYEYDLDITLLSREQVYIIKRLDEEHGKKLRVHINIDTGMRRLGLLLSDEKIDELADFANALRVEDKLNLVGLYSHFATADEADKTDAILQLELFNRLLAKVNTDDLLVHIANSAAIVDLESSHKNLLRAGIVIYGLYPSDEVSREKVDLEPALSWKSHVIAIRDLKSGESVSYGGTFVADRDMRVATVGIGYADGYSRRLSNSGQMLIRGKRVDILGRICMDLTVVDVTGMDVEVDDEVVLIGRQGEEEIAVDEIASIMGSINYEVTCGISKRVKRIYV